MKQIHCSSLKNTFLVTFLTLISIQCFSQSSFSNNFWENVRFGGGIGLNFGNSNFNGSLSPNAIYQFNDKFAMGVGLSINYSKFDTSKLLAYGASVNTFYNPINFLQLSVEFEQLRVNRKTEFSTFTIKDNFWSPALYLGIGYTQKNYTVGVRYDVIHNDKRSIYQNTLIPFIRVYF